MTESLYERLGGTEGIKSIANDLVEIHMENPALSPRYAPFEKDALKNGAATFFIAGTGGPSVYEGKDMLETHKGMNVSNDEFMAVLDDVIKALKKNDIGQREQEEVLYTFFSMKGEIVGT